MKSFALFAAALLIGFSAATSQAMVREAGTFIPSLCGEHYADAEVSIGHVNQVCIGYIVGEESRGDFSSVAFRLDDGSERVFRVAQVSSFLMAMASGITNSNFHLVDDSGQSSTMTVLQAQDGEIVSATGTLEHANYYVPEFEQMFTIQSL